MKLNKLIKQIYTENKFFPICNIEMWPQSSIEITQ